MACKSDSLGLLAKNIAAIYLRFCEVFFVNGRHSRENRNSENLGITNMFARYRRHDEENILIRLYI